MNAAAPPPRRHTLHDLPRLRAADRVRLASVLARRSAGEATPGFRFHATCARCSAVVDGDVQDVPPGCLHGGEDIDPVLRCEGRQPCGICGAFEIVVHAEELIE